MPKITTNDGLQASLIGLSTLGLISAFGTGIASVAKEYNLLMKFLSNHPECSGTSYNPCPPPRSGNRDLLRSGGDCDPPTAMPIVCPGNEILAHEANTSIHQQIAPLKTATWVELAVGALPIVAFVGWQGYKFFKSRCTSSSSQNEQVALLNEQGRDEEQGYGATSSAPGV